MNKQIFCYAVKVSGLANNSQSTQTINFANDSNFKLSEIRTTGTALVLLTLSMSDGKQFNNIAFDSSLIGKGQNALKLFKDVSFDANSTLNVIFDNQSGGAVTEEVQFWGLKE